MAFDGDLTNSIREQGADLDGLTAQAMFGAPAFRLRADKAVGIANAGALMVRAGAEATDDALVDSHTRPLEMSGQPISGWILVAPEGVKAKRHLAGWVGPGVRSAGILPPKG